MAMAEEKCDTAPFPTLRWVEPHRFAFIDERCWGGVIGWFLLQMLMILGATGLLVGLVFGIIWLSGNELEHYQFMIAMLLAIFLICWLGARIGVYPTWVTVSEEGVKTSKEGPGRRTPPMVYSWTWKEVAACRLTKVLHDKDEFRVLELHLKSGKEKSIAICDSISLVALESAIKAAGVEMRH